MTHTNMPAGTVHIMPRDLHDALLADTDSLVAWQDITPLARNEWICWVESAKLIETRARRVSRASLAKAARHIRPSRKLTATLSFIAIVGVGAFATYYFWPSSYVTLPDGQRVRTDSPQIKERLPQFSTITPGGKDIRELGGWARVSPADSNPVFAYADSLDETDITVSQQPLPENLKGNTNEKITELAKAYSASNALKVDGQTFFVGTASEGPQSVILAKDDLLILIKSSEKVSDDKWKQYVKSLQ